MCILKSKHPVGIDRQIRYFLKIAECSSLSRAADELEVTQSGLSRQLAALESFIGQPLFMRTGRGVTLTDIGEELRQSTGLRYAEIDSAIEAARDKFSRQGGSLRVATIHNWNDYFVSGLLMKFVTQIGHVSLAVMARSSPEIVELVEKGKADIGFVYDSAVASNLLDSVGLSDENMCLVVDEETYRDRDVIDLGKVTVPLVAFPADYALRAMLKTAGLDHQVVAEANTIDAVLQLVSSGMGSCVLPERIPQKVLAEYGLKKLAIAAPLLKRRVVAIVRHNIPADSMAWKLFEMARNEVL